MNNDKLEFNVLTNRLRDKIANGAYDDSYLNDLATLGEIAPLSLEFALFYARYALAAEQYDMAWEFALRAHKQRKLDGDVLKLLAELAAKVGTTKQYIFWSVMANKFGDALLPEDIYTICDGNLLDVLSAAAGIGNYAPFLARSANLSHDTPTFNAATTIGRFILPLHDDKRPPYWVGVYAEQDQLHYKGEMLTQLADNKLFASGCGINCTFDLMRSQTVNDNITLNPSADVVIPIAGTVQEQILQFRGQNMDEEVELGKLQFSFFRLHETTTLSSADKFIMGAPVVMRHSHKRRKLVLNILVDALSWGAEKKFGFAHVPNLRKFFQTGVTFNNHYSIAEFTYPSFAAIESGMHSHHSQNFYEMARTELEPEYKTISEQMKDLGYYCVNLMGDGSGIYNGSTRGFDRMVIAPYAIFAYEATERLIRHLQAFADTDQYILLHFMDAHPWSTTFCQVPLAVQTKLSLKNRLYKATLRNTSVNLPHTPLLTTSVDYGVENADRSLGVLFEYLEKNYDPSEYTVCLYSDHGVSIYDEEQYLFSEMQCNAALMLCGAGVPAAGDVEELVSSLDIYPIMSKINGFSLPDYCDGNLPAVFGGKERDYVISNSIYPGKQYMLAIRSKKYSCHLVSKSLVTEDGTIDLNNSEVYIYTREENPQLVKDEAVFQHFLPLIRAHTRPFERQSKKS